MYIVYTYQNIILKYIYGIYFQRIDQNERMNYKNLYNKRETYLLNYK